MEASVQQMLMEPVLAILIVMGLVIAGAAGAGILLLVLRGQLNDMPVTRHNPAVLDDNVITADDTAAFSNRTGVVYMSDEREKSIEYDIGHNHERNRFN